jgi:hypothetical protein
LWKTEGKRQLGRGMLRWEVAVKMDLKETSWISEEGQI